MKRFFHSDLDELKSHLMLMGEKAGDAVRKSVQALIDEDVELAESVIKGDDEIDSLEITIDQEAIRYLTLRSPVASDLRLLTVAIKASHDLERVGDEARNIAKRVRKLLLKSGLSGNLFSIAEMDKKAREMLRHALSAFLHEETEKATEVLAQDEIVDNLNSANYKAFIREAKGDPEALKRYLDLIFISKSLERIADHATNLAEEVIFLTTARESRHNPEV
jgi:phosphate transport system protein